jgi:hypothetical protein
MNKLAVLLIILCGVCVVHAQEAPAEIAEKRVSLGEPATAHDASGVAALEATLRTTALRGAPDAPITNARLIVKNTSTISYSFVSGAVTFYDAAGVRCGEAIFKADALAVNESFETDTPGLRIRCEAASWRIVATHLVPRVAHNSTTTPLERSTPNLVLVIDGESHPVQLDRPLVLTLGERRRTMVVRTAP